MNATVLRRRIAYICAIVALIVPLYFLGRPAVRNRDGSIKQAGGTLAGLRDNYNLGQGDLGEIEPASESMRLATLGLRGPAATILWQKAEYYKREQYWDRLSATLNQIAALQPHFIEIWKFQSHNMSYNVSTQFDNYRHRYQWVKRGMDYLVRGSKVNKHRTEMPYELGWFFGNKMGVADEKIQYRELYRDDRDFHEEILETTGLDVTKKEGIGPDQKPDNWLTGRLWYLRSYAMVEEGYEPAKSSLMFYQKAPQWLMKYSEAIQKEGYFTQAARFGWRSSQEGWADFGKRQILTTWGDTIFLSEVEQANTDYKEAENRFAEFCGETWDRLRAAKLNSLSPTQRKAIATPYSERTFDQILLAENAELMIEMNPVAVAKQLDDPEKSIQAMQMAKNMVARLEKIGHIEIYRSQVNYAYWAERCLAEQNDDALAARQSMYEAEKFLEKAQLEETFASYEKAFQSWYDLFKQHPAMMVDDVADDILASITRYQRLLDVDELPEDFPLNDFIKFREVYEDQLADPAMLGVISQWPKRYPGRDFLKEMLRKSEIFAQQVADGEAIEQAFQETQGNAPKDPTEPDNGPPEGPAEKPTEEPAEPAEEPAEPAEEPAEPAEEPAEP
ncbi:MAG: hypothetical protein AAF483_16155, partial [Planctomycetota bacterium]